MTRALKDIVQAITKFPMFIIFTAWLDIRVRYRRSTLGPWWITLSMIIFTATLSIVYSRPPWSGNVGFQRAPRL